MPLISAESSPVGQQFGEVGRAGPAGAAIVAAQAAIILIALVLVFRARGAWRHVAHAVLLGWILFWLYRIGHMAIVFGDWVHWGLAAICLLAAFAQITLWPAAEASRVLLLQLTGCEVVSSVTWFVHMN